MSLSVHFKHTQGTPLGYSCYVSVDQQLQHRGGDFSIFANHGDYVAQPGDTELLKAIMEATITSDTSGVFQVDVRPYMLIVHHSYARKPEELRGRILHAIRQGGKVRDVKVISDNE